MKTEMREQLARLPFEEKIRKVGELIRLSRDAKISMNTASSGSGRVDDIKSHPQGEIREATKLVKRSARSAN